MRWRTWQGAGRMLAGVGLGLLTAGGMALDAPAASLLSFDVELDEGLEGNFGTILLEDHSDDAAIPDGSLRITLSLSGELGPEADIHELYFNLPSAFGDDDLEISGFTCNGGRCRTGFTLEDDPPVRGGAGSSFDVGVNFGNGAGKKGNGTLQTASFLLASEEGPLAIQDLLAESSETRRGIEIFFALHVQETDLARKSDSETVGVVVPEPATAALFACGLLGLVVAGRRRRARH